MSSLKAFGGNNILNMAATKFYNANPNKFKDNGTQGGVQYSYQVISAPVITLIPNNNSKNISISLTVSVKLPDLSFDKNIPLTASAKVNIVNGVLSITNLTLAGVNPVDALIVGLFNAVVLPNLSTALSSIPIPALTGVFGPSLSPQILGMAVLNNPALEIRGKIAGTNINQTADTPSAANLNSLNTGNNSNAKIIGCVVEGAVNHLIKTLLPDLSHSFDKRASKWGLGAGIKGTIKASKPVMTINNGVGVAKTTISFSGLKAGIDPPFAGWQWVNLPSPTATITVKHLLRSIGNTGVIEIKGIDSFSVNFDFPLLLKPVEVLLETLLKGIFLVFKGIINNAINGRKIEIFKLPSKVPGTNYSASLSFAPNGLAYHGKSVEGIVKVTT
ncbi:MAG: hypothetical protein IPF52_13390 [Saprospiraceae bacterium]|nr:hypothetical protein [Saprospiraceae bacterium]MBK8373170.1 hypothetical protein [Saprospiraceae bacterium]